MRGTSILNETTAEDILLNQALAISREHNYGLALWRLPNTSELQLVISRSPRFIPKDALIEELPTGFIFSPYDKARDSVFLESDFRLTFSDKKIKNPERTETSAAMDWLTSHLKKDGPLKGFRPLDSPVYEAEKSQFLQLVNKGIEEIERGAMKKVVPSRIKKIPLTDQFDVLKTFQRLAERYPQSFISYVDIPEVGHWIGASPELLVSVENGKIFKTVALAGTKAYEEGTNIKNVAWTQKEIEEQALVERYIINCFKIIRLREYEENGPKTFVAGNLMHLCSDFTVDMQATNFPQLGSVMLHLLHPTSAVCGMPLEVALDFLKKNENYDRAFYSGYLGPVNFDHATNIFVNLRCMQLFDNTAILYAGAGVTIDSNPEQEWNEIEMKFNTLLRVIT